MKKSIIALTLCLVFASSGNSFAETEPQQRHKWELGGEISHITYTEPGVMQEKGFMAGVAGSYTKYRSDLMFRVEGKLSYGKLDYESENTGSSDNIPDYMLEFRLLGGRDYPVFAKSVITPYAGFGYRYLNDDSSYMLTTTGHIGYERESNYYYSPVGFETRTELENGWSFGIKLEYDHFWKGKQISHLGYIAGERDIENTQNDGYGYRGSLRFQKNGKRLYVIEPFIRYWSIEDSEVDCGPAGCGVDPTQDYIEPENDSKEIGLRVSVKF